ncbi:hypothetical protein ACTXT7_004792 [Hymenolepis weldensis]
MNSIYLLVKVGDQIGRLRTQEEDRTRRIDEGNGFGHQNPPQSDIPDRFFGASETLTNNTRLATAAKSMVMKTAVSKHIYNGICSLVKWTERFQSFDMDFQQALEEGIAVNWWNHCQPTCDLISLLNRKNGDCLLDSVLQATMSVCDEDGQLRRTLTNFLSKYEPYFKQVWLQHETEVASNLGEFSYELSTEALDDEWSSLMNAAKIERHHLGQIHVFALAQIFHRPIIVLSPKFVKDKFDNEIFSLNDMGGIYLPLMWSAKLCSREPIFLGYVRNHFSALIPRTFSKTPRQQKHQQHQETYALSVSEKEDTFYIPLYDANKNILPLPFASFYLQSSSPNFSTSVTGKVASLSDELRASSSIQKKVDSTSEILYLLKMRLETVPASTPENFDEGKDHLTSQLLLVRFHNRLLSNSSQQIEQYMRNGTAEQRRYQNRVIAFKNGQSEYQAIIGPQNQIQRTSNDYEHKRRSRNDNDISEDEENKDNNGSPLPHIPSKVRIGPSKIPLQVQSSNISSKDPQSYPTFQNSGGKLPELEAPNEIPEYPPRLPLNLHTNDQYCREYISPDGRQIGRIPNAISKLLASTGNDVSIRHNVYPLVPPVPYRPPTPIPRNPWCESNNGIHLTMPFPNAFTNVIENTNDVKAVNSYKVEYPRNC